MINVLDQRTPAPSTMGNPSKKDQRKRRWNNTDLGKGLNQAYNRTFVEGLGGPGTPTMADAASTIVTLPALGGRAAVNSVNVGRTVGRPPRSALDVLKNVAQPYVYPAAKAGQSAYLNAKAGIATAVGLGGLGYILSRKNKNQDDSNMSTVDGPSTGDVTYGGGGYSTDTPTPTPTPRARGGGGGGTTGTVDPYANFTDIENEENYRNSTVRRSQLNRMASVLKAIGVTGVESGADITPAMYKKYKEKIDQGASSGSLGKILERVSPKE